MGDRIVSTDEGSGRYHISLSTLVDIVKREDKEYLDSFEGVGGLAGQLDTSLENGLSQDEAADDYSARVAVYVNHVDPIGTSILNLTEGFFWMLSDSTHGSLVRTTKDRHPFSRLASVLLACLLTETPPCFALMCC